jgi:hypothetical protein
VTIANKIETINIRPGVSILSVLRHLNYSPWFALAEFVDNSLQSYLDYKDDLMAAEGNDYRLKITVKIETESEYECRITIYDNAAGIHERDYERAFRPAEIPLDVSGLCEFGMGMKSAACWFTDNWIVRTKALNEFIERKVEFDINTIVNDKIEELKVKNISAFPSKHFTEVTLQRLYRPLKSKTISKIKTHLASIYRTFIRDGILELRFINNDEDELLQYIEPNILVVPYYKNLIGDKVKWYKEISFDFGLGLKVNGFAALRETASVSGAGFSLFRRGRLIEGSADDGYRPEKIFKKSNSYTYQRLFGELHLDGFEVSHTKDGFRWGENEEVFLELLKEELNNDPIRLLDQAEGYRVRFKPEDFQKEVNEAIQHTAEVVRNEVPHVLEKGMIDKPEFNNPPLQLPIASIIPTSRDIEIELHNCIWNIHIELTNDPIISDWISISDQPNNISEKSGQIVRKLGMGLSLAHPFMERFCGTDASLIEPILRIAVSICLAQTAARDSGVTKACTFSRNINELLRDAMSKP